MLTGSFKRVFNTFKEPITINGVPSEGCVFVYGESEDKKLDEYGVWETSQVNLWLLPDTQIEVGDTVELRGKEYRVVEVKNYLNIAKKAVLEKADV